MSLKSELSLAYVRQTGFVSWADRTLFNPNLIEINASISPTLASVWLDRHIHDACTVFACICWITKCVFLSLGCIDKLLVRVKGVSVDVVRVILEIKQTLRAIYWRDRFLNLLSPLRGQFCGFDSNHWGQIWFESERLGLVIERDASER